jgi:hypothetical protein
MQVVRRMFQNTDKSGNLSSGNPFEVQCNVGPNGGDCGNLSGLGADGKLSRGELNQFLDRLHSPDTKKHPPADEVEAAQFISQNFNKFFSQPPDLKDMNASIPWTTIIRKAKEDGNKKDLSIQDFAPSAQPGSQVQTR